MKDNITHKLVLVVFAVAALSLAIWTGVKAQVEAPAQDNAPAASYSIPF